MRFFGALLPFLVCVPLLAQRVKVYQIELTLDDVRAARRSTVELRPVSGQDRPITISYGPGDEPRVFEAAVLADGCDPSSTESNGCDRMTFDPFRGRVEMRSFARGKGMSLALDGAPTLFQRLPLRMETGRVADARGRITSPAAPATSERVTYEVNVGGRRHALAVDFRVRRGPATLLPLAALLREVLGREAVPRTTGDQFDKSELPPTPGGGPGRSCFICDLCSHLPGGQTLGGCLGPPSLGGGGGGTGGSKSCTVSTENALQILQDVVLFDLTTASSLCESTFASTVGTATSRFAKEATRFQAKVDIAGLDPKSRACAACFRDMAKLFVSGGSGLTEIKGILEGNCIKDYSTLTSSPFVAQHKTMKARAQKFIDDQAVCKKLCDDPPAPRRAYCDCLSLYLGWAPGPYPGTASCTP